MIPLLDVNILIPVHRQDHPHHTQMFEYFSQLRETHATFAVPEIVASAVVRIVTSASSFKPRLSTTTEAFGFIAAVTASPGCQLIRPTKGHWNIFEALSRSIKAKGKLIPDAYLAAMAIDQGFELVTNDADFAVFGGLTWRHALNNKRFTNPPG